MGVLRSVSGILGGASGSGFYNFTGSNLSVYSAARALTLAGTANSKIACLGDSTVAGAVSNGSPLGNNAQSLSWPTLLQGLLSNSSWQSIWGDRNILSQSASINAFDNRQSDSASFGTTGQDGLGGVILTANASADGIVFTPTS